MEPTEMDKYFYFFLEVLFLLTCGKLLNILIISTEVNKPI